MQGDFNVFAVARQGFIDAVVYDFLDQVIWVGCVGVHAGPALYGFETGQDFDIPGLVLFAHVVPFIGELIVPEACTKLGALQGLIILNCAHIFNLICVRN